jgi:hypothetical protein
MATVAAAQRPRLAPRDEQDYRHQHSLQGLDRADVLARREADLASLLAFLRNGPPKPNSTSYPPAAGLVVQATASGKRDGLRREKLNRSIRLKGRALLKLKQKEEEREARTDTIAGDRKPGGDGGGRSSLGSIESDNAYLLSTRHSDTIVNGRAESLTSARTDSSASEIVPVFNINEVSSGHPMIFGASSSNSLTEKTVRVLYFVYHEETGC